MMTERPSHVRYLVVASASLMSVLLYLDRFCVSIAEVYIQQDLGLTDGDIGLILGAFFWTYALGQVPSGWLTDRYGSRIMLTIYILSWSLFTALTGLAGGFIVLLLLRFGFGLAQAGAYPTAASMVSVWVPLQARGRASSLIAVGGRVGGFLALFATGYILIWLTPGSTPATLEPADILHGPRLCFELQEIADPPTETTIARQHCLERFSTAARQVVEAQAAQYVVALDEERSRLTAAGQNPRDAVVPPTPLAAQDLELIVTELNGIIQQAGFFHGLGLTSVPLEKEAKHYLKRPVSDLTEQQSQRLNRLVLEALHRKAFKMFYVAGWRPMMFFYGSLGLLVAAAIWWSSRTSPTEHPWCNDAEVRLIQGDRPARPQTQGQVGGVPIVPLLRSVSMWLCCVSQWFTNVGWVFLMTWAPRYFNSVHQVSVSEQAMMVAIPPLVGWAGMISGGAATDKLVGWLGLRWGRALPMSLSRFVAMFAYLACLASPSPWFAVTMFSIVAFATDFGTPAVWGYVQDTGGRHVGSILGWGNMWGNLGAAVTPPLLIWIVGTAERWDLAFLTCAMAFLLAGLAAIFINATQPIVPVDVDDEHLV